MPHTLSKSDLIDAAVAVVQERCQQALTNFEADSNAAVFEYIEAHAIVGQLEEQGLVSHADSDSRDYNAREKARKSIENKAKRLLDEEAAKPGARLLRFSSRDDLLLPRLNGTRRKLYGQAVAYITPDLYAACVAAAEAADKARSEREAEMAFLLQRTRDAGWPEPSQTHPTGVAYDLDAFRALVEFHS